MTEQSIDELKRQMDAALSAAAEADRKFVARREAYEAALCRQKLAEFEAMGGVVGVTRVRAGNAWLDNNAIEMKKGPFFVIGAESRWGKARFVLAKIKKDGTASASPSGVNPDKVFIIPEDQIGGAA